MRAGQNVCYPGLRRVHVCVECDVMTQRRLRGIFTVLRTFCYRDAVTSIGEFCGYDFQLLSNTL